MATFVLVHGAWFGGWCWQKVIPFLEEASHEVYAPTLTGLAERASELSPDIGLETHIQDIVGELVEKNLHDIVLVGHSYGAIVITGVVDQVPERIAHLVYLDTFVPRDGESMADVSPVVIGLLRKQAQSHGDGYKVASRGCIGYLGHPFEKETPWAYITLRFLSFRWYSAIDRGEKRFSCTRENRRACTANHQGRHAKRHERAAKNLFRHEATSWWTSSTSWTLADMVPLQTAQR